MENFTVFFAASRNWGA